MRRVYNSRISQRANDCLRRRERALQVKRQILILAAVVVTGLAILLGSSIRAMASSPKKAEMHKYYTSIAVERGDTLWALADDYIAEGLMDRKAFIAEVSELNHLTDGHIHSGAHIIVPYYSEEVK
ncbi:MAG: LysM peptidoglycan-binding domain-containing protein [Agathobacter sp.]|nr:LysM peptidoglycan-binding domain-containing protein [Agathobacter sp.]